MQNEDNDNQEESNLALSKRENVGKKLRAIREEKKLTIDDFILYSSFPRHKIESFESGNYAKVGVDTFVIGYIRKYCAWVGENSQPFVNEYQGEPAESKYARNALEEKNSDQQTDILIAKNKIKVDDASGGEVFFTKNTFPKKYIFVAAVIIGVMVWLIVSLFDEKPASSSVSENNQIETLPQKSLARAEQIDINAATSSLENEGRDETTLTNFTPTELPEANATATVNSTTPLSDIELITPVIEKADETLNTHFESKPATEDDNTVSDENSSNDEILSSDSNLSADVSIDASRASNLINGEDLLKLTFIDDCWLEIKNSAGKVLFAGLKKAGSEHIEMGTSPFSVMLGNARAATATLNDEPVNIEPLPGKNTLRFQVSN